jgi:hypothetical protein
MRKKKVVAMESDEIFQPNSFENALRYTPMP